MKNKLLFDWLTFTTKIHSIGGVIVLLGLTHVNFIDQNGSYGYKKRLFFQNISILYDGSDDMGICVEITGQGCRAFENYDSGDWDELFNILLYEPNDINITRLDVAYDDIEESLLDIDILCEDTRYGNYISKFRKNKVVYGTDGNSIELGTRLSDIMLRIYDKKAEQQSKGMDVDCHWVRVEIQLRRERATVFLKHYCTYHNLGYLFKGLLLNYLRYIDVNDDSNKSRCKMLPYWSNFMESCEKITIWSKQEIDYNLFKLEDFVINQAGNAIDTYIKIVGQEEFFNQLRKRLSLPNVKYEKLLQKYGL